MFNNLLSLAYIDTGERESEEGDGETERGRPEEEYQRQTERDEME